MSGFRSLTIYCLAFAAVGCAAGYTQPVTLTLSPATVNLDPGKNQTFTVVPSSGPVPTVVWTIAETGNSGIITTGGVYTAPDDTGGTYHVVATTPTGELTAQAAVYVGSPGAVEILLSPTEITVAAGQTQAFNATVLKTADTAVSWTVQEAGGGTIDASGLYTAPQAAGTYHVVATAHADTTKSAIGTVTVTPPPVQVAVSINPTTASLLTNATASFSASVTGTANSAVTWSVQEAAGGTISATGLYTAPATAGTWHVVATSAADTTKSAAAAVTVAAPAVAVSINPSAVNVLTSATATFTATVTNGSNTSVTWSVQEAAGGAISAAGLYTAPALAGTYHIVATSKADTTKSATATAVVSATPVVVVSVNPQTATVPSGGTFAFSAGVTGSADAGVTWSVTEAGGGSVSAVGLYTAPAAGGTYHVVVTSHADTSKSATAAVTVTPVSIGLNLTTATVAQGATQAFACNVTGAVNTACTWSVTEAGGGSVSAAGLYTAPNTAGTFHVVAKSSADPSKTASATITVPAVTVAISPSTVTLLAGGAQVFTCAVTGSVNKACTFAITEGAAGGTIAAGAYVAPTTGGTWHVVATSAADTSKTSTATITVSSPKVVIAPKTVTLAVLGSQAFTCTVTGAVDTACSWSALDALGGLVGALTGIYVAPALPGVFHVTAASHANPSITDIATVTVQAVASGITVAVSPKAAALGSGGAQTFSCVVSGSADGACTWAVTEAGGGTITAGGLYTAPAAAGTYHVVATSHADGSKTDTAIVTVTQPTDLVVSFTDVRQNIDGFGASDAFNSSVFSDAQADLFFCQSATGAGKAGQPCQTSGIGLSLLRLGIDENGNALRVWGGATKAAARGARVWAAPWSPTASMKDTGDINTGSLKPTSYDAWATVLAGVPAKVKAQTGVDLYAISVQNEPDYNTQGAYRMCLYTGAQMDAFIKVLGPKLAALNPRPKLMGPETSPWGNLWPSFGDVFAQDSAASAFIDILATHQYDYTTPAHAIPAGKSLWETEVSSFDGATTSIGNAITVARWINDALTISNVSAWHYWWLNSENPDNEGLVNVDGSIPKRLYAFGNYSKFVRPGYVRVGTTGGQPNVYSSAFKDPVTGNFAVVMINANFGAFTQKVDFSGAAAPSVTPQLTDANNNLIAQAALDSSSGAVTVSLPGQSIVTITGTAH
jgi:O-glycosyl hydrolase